MATKRKPRAKRESWGSIRELPSGRLQARYSVDGKTFTAPHTFDAYEDARAYLAAVRTDITRGMWRSPDQLAAEAAENEKRAAAERFGLYAETWIAQRVTSKAKPLRPKTAAEYRRQLTRGLAIFADDRLTAITPARVRAWHADRMKIGPTAAGAEARLLRAVMGTAVHDGILSQNPVPTELTRTETGIAHRPPTLAELGIVLDTIEPFYRLAIVLSAYAGLRLSELRALRRSDLTIHEGRVLVRVERAAQYIAKEGWHVGPPKSAEGERTVPLPAALTGDVERHLAEFVGDFAASLIFAPSGLSKYVHDRQFNDAWNVARDAAGIRGKVRLHDLRGFAGTTFAQGGATLRETMAFLGHSTTDAAMRYQYAAADRLSDLADRMPLPTPGARPTVTQIRDAR
ncbi:MAG: site-specific integrase [Microbacteriaceae bacterium]|nr:site-specific integrase [Microbacteriaceae bacterium]MCL2795028.1 site-specific integrase [Microbacteriaceae bacterium]